MEIDMSLVVRTSPQTWSSLQVLYESGEYSNLQRLHDLNCHKFSDMPKLRTLLDYARDHCWDKERLQEISTEVKRRNLIDLYAQLGMDDIEQAKYRIECIRAFDDIKVIIAQLFSNLNGLDPNSKLYNDTLGKIKVLTDTMFKGMSTSLAALQDLAKLTGSYAPEKTKEIKSHSYGNKGANNEIEDMSEEEILQDLKRMQAAGLDIATILPPETSPDEQRGPNEP